MNCVDGICVYVLCFFILKVGIGCVVCLFVENVNLNVVLRRLKCIGLNECVS